MSNLDKLETYISSVRKGYYYNYSPQLFDQIYEYLKGTTDQVPNCNSISFWYLNGFIDLLSDSIDNWNEFDDKVMKLATQKNVWDAPKKMGDYLSGCYIGFIRWMCKQIALNNSIHLVKKLEQKAQSFSINHSFFIHGIVYEGVPLLDNAKKTTGLGQVLLEDIETKIDTYFQVFKQNYLPFLNFLLATRVDLVDKYVDRFIQNDSQIPVFEALLRADAQKYEPIIEKKLATIKHSANLIAINNLLLDCFPEKYKPRTTALMFNVLEKEHQIMKSAKANYNPNGSYNQLSNKYEYFIETCVSYLLKNKIEGAKEKIHEVLKDCYQIPIQVISSIVINLGQDSLDMLMEAMKMDINSLHWGNNNFFKEYFRLLGTLDYSKYEQDIWNLSSHKSKKMRELVAITLSKLGDKAIPQATELLQSKKADIRQTGALILSLIKTDKALEILNNALETEKNDDARDLMLEGLKGVLTLEPTQEKIKAKVAKAKERGKLEKPIEIWLNEAQMPVLFWKEGTKLDIETTRFLLYRMSRAKDIRIDIEAKSILDLLDKTQSQPFANALLKAFFTLGGADAKQKYCLTLGSILGDDDEIDILKRKVNEWVENSRGKMAEYAVKAIALNGSTKALRAVEFFSRKYKNKNKNIGAAANESFTLVAEELGVSPYDLADAIIPDFGFDGLFKEFEVNGETYRAFIGNDFKLAFLNEDNKFFKSVPKGTSKEIQEEFKEIGKEIKDIVKSQSSRLEQYLVIQRKWNAEKWQAFFMTNPVMFVYAIRLIWGAFDQKQQLLFTFSVQEDQTLLNEEGDEIELEEGVFIGMVHPISLQETQKNTWIERLADADLESIFPQLTRPVISFRDKDKGIKMSKEFQGIEFGGYAFVAKLEKSGWFRGSVVDGGGISSYYKDFSELGITAILMQEGCIGVGYLDENAVLGELMFVNNKTVQFGSYMYDEPSKAEDPRLIPFENVPAIIYSEVIADMQFFKDNNAKM